MKSFVATLLLGGTAASHFRAGTYVITQESNGLQLSRSQTWRRGRGGYTPQCEQTHIDNATPANVMVDECTLNSGGSCGTFPSMYFNFYQLLLFIIIIIYYNNY